MEMFQLTIHHDNAGVNSIFAFSFFSATGYLLSLLWNGRRRGSFSDDDKRMMLGISMMCFGIGVRIGSWVPWRFYLAHNLREAADAYRDYSWLWTWGGVLFSVTGLILVLYPAVKRKTGSFAPAAVLLALLSFYAFGVLNTQYMGTILDFFL